jgi:hypothetical protein
MAPSTKRSAPSSAASRPNKRRKTTGTLNFTLFSAHPAVATNNQEAPPESAADTPIEKPKPKAKTKRNPPPKQSKATKEANSKIADNRRLDADGLPHTESPCFNGGHIIRQIEEINGRSWVKMTCTACLKEWLVETEKASITSNFYRHYKKFHPSIDPYFVEGKDEEPALEERQNKVTDFWTAGQQRDTSWVRKRGVPFVLDTFIRLVVQFIVANSLAIRLVTTTSFHHLIQYCSGKTIELKTQQLVRHMIRFYQECANRERDRFRTHISDGSRITLTCDGWDATNGDGYMGVTAHWIDADWNVHGTLIEFGQLPPSHTGNSSLNQF